MTPDLSIIIPTLNEQENISALLGDIQQQQGISLEVIIADGGSVDHTLENCQRFTGKHPIHTVHADAGRACQMNAGAQKATAPELLFLHADTRMEDTLLLNRARAVMQEQRQKSQGLCIAGHFPLRFLRHKSGFEQAYYFYESKTSLNRPDCINGDQGFWLHREFFQSLGGFDESLPYMEDARLALRIFQLGDWQTLPGYLSTSARRFETEGLTQRQILNSFLCNFNSIGLDYFFTAALDAYRTQNRTQELRLRPFLLLAQKQMHGDGLLAAIKRWYQTGGYIADNAWQLAYALDCRQNKKRQTQPGNGTHKKLDFFDRYLQAIISSPPCRAITGILTFVWFHSLFLRYTESTP